MFLVQFLFSLLLFKVNRNRKEKKQKKKKYAVTGPISAQQQQTASTTRSPSSLTAAWAPPVILSLPSSHPASGPNLPEPSSPTATPLLPHTTRRSAHVAHGQTPRALKPRNGT